MSGAGDSVLPPHAPGRLDTPKYRADIDGLRGLAVLSVVGYHAFPAWVRGGFVGVDIFFVISGYLICSIILGSLQQNRFSFWEFYGRRIRRIFPALILVLATCYALGWNVLYADEFKQLGKHIAGGAGFISNFLFWKESGYFDSAAEVKPMLHLWSLGIEEQFYLVWPLLLYLAWKVRRNVLVLTLLVLVASFVMNVSTVHGDAVEAFYSPASRFWELMIGGLLAHTTLNATGAADQHHGNLGKWRDSMAFAGAALVVVAVLALNRDRVFPGWWALLPTAGTMLLILAGPKAWLNRHVLSRPALVWAGLISYPLYLWHWPLLSFARIVESGTPIPEIRIAAILGSILLAWLTYRLIERPIRFGRHGAAKTIVLTMLMVVTGYAGYNAYRRDGLEFRSINRTIKRHLADLKAVESTRTSDDSCPLRLGITPAKNETCLAKSSHPTILVIGDSHAMALNSAAYLGRVDLNTLIISEHGCLPFASPLNHGPGDPQRNKNCGEIAEHAIHATKNLPTIRTVVINTLDVAYISTLNCLVTDEEKSMYGTVVDPNDKDRTCLDNERAFEIGYSRTISTYEALGKKVVFVIDNPQLRGAPRNCGGRPFAITKRSSYSCAIARTAVDLHQESYRQLVRRLQALHPNLVVFDSAPVFCDDERCYGKLNGELYYFDGSHLSIGGSLKLLDALAPVIK